MRLLLLPCLLGFLPCLRLRPDAARQPSDARHLLAPYLPRTLLLQRARLPQLISLLLLPQLVLHPPFRRLIMQCTKWELRRLRAV